MKKKQIIISIILITLVSIGIGLFFLLNPKDDSPTDAEKFSKEYSQVEKENPFVYRTQDEILKILENGTGIIYLGFPECPWCQSYVKYLNEVAKSNNIEKIFYYNIMKDRQENNDFYQKIVSLLKEELQFDDEGNKRIYVPAVIILNNGKIVGFDDETAWDTKGYKTPEDYWEKEDLNNFKKKLKNLLEKAKPNICTSECNN